MDIYTKAIQSLRIPISDTILVVCGGLGDATILRSLKYKNVTISNVAPEGHHVEGTDFGDYRFQSEDAEQLSCSNGSFDWVMVRAGLHHCGSPHRALLEMCRVAKKGVVVVESRDSALIRLAVLLGLVPDYELEAVALRNYQGGGLRNGKTPNYVYRWTEREVHKTIASAYPHRINNIRFMYGLTLPTQRLAMSGPIKRLTAGLLGVGASVLHKIAPKQCNQFAFVILHDCQSQPWIEETADGFELKRGSLNFDPSRYTFRNTAR